MTRRDGHIQGEESEMKVALDLIDNGCRVAYTHGHTHPYDLIADRDGELLKIQVKTAKHLRTRKHSIELSDAKKYDAKDVDLFAGYARKEDDVFYVPNEEMGKRASVTFTSPEKMGSEESRERAKLAEEYTFEASYKRLSQER